MKTIEEQICDFMYDNIGCCFSFYPEKAKKLFDLYNEGKVGPYESSYTCSACVDRVVWLMKKFVKNYENIKQQQ